MHNEQGSPMEAITNELDYVTFRTAKMLRQPNVEIIAHFGVGKAARLELRYQSELAMGLVGTYADDSAVCTNCGRKHCMCAPMTRAEWDRTLR